MVYLVYRIFESVCLFRFWCLEVVMIKCEVVFDGDSMCVNGWYVYEGHEEYYEAIKGDELNSFGSLEEAIKYCLVN